MANLQFVGFEKYPVQEKIAKRTILRSEECLKRSYSILSQGLSKSIANIPSQVRAALALYFKIDYFNQTSAEILQIMYVRNGMARMLKGFNANSPLVFFDRRDPQKRDWYQKTFKKVLKSTIPAFYHKPKGASVPIIDLVYPYFDELSQLSRDHALLHEMAHGFVKAPREIYYLSSNGISNRFNSMNYQQAIENADSYALAAIDIYYGEAAYYEKNFQKK